MERSRSRSPHAFAGCVRLPKQRRCELEKRLHAFMEQSNVASLEVFDTSDGKGILHRGSGSDVSLELDYLRELAVKHGLELRLPPWRPELVSELRPIIFDPRRDAEMTIDIVGLAGTVLCVTRARRSWTIADVKKDIYKQLGIFANEQKLVEGSRSLGDDCCVGSAQGVSATSLAAELNLIKLEPRVQICQPEHYQNGRGGHFSVGDMDAEDSGDPERDKHCLDRMTADRRASAMVAESYCKHHRVPCWGSGFVYGLTMSAVEKQGLRFETWVNLEGDNGFGALLRIQNGSREAIAINWDGDWCMMCKCEDMGVSGICIRCLRERVPEEFWKPLGFSVQVQESN
eukprot:TRINITY_DN42128_c0_g1_i1.p1 TRINITY_DN42128_c0_g1~~TRINITY_DN42128_c0_g1_i1.p1  ORF type:complete len:344 (-),score=55.59 TRINITY_DN42128_c0_g1_i1:44-1075(-)